MPIDLDNCQCNDEQPALVCFSCWRKGVRHKDRLGKPDGTLVTPVPPIVEVPAIEDRLLRYKAAGILDCTCPKLKSGCPTHGEFYGSKIR